MLDCLFGYVGLKTGEEAVYDVPESGLFINSLPGISLQMVDKIAENEQVYYQGVWDDAQSEAAIRFKIDFISELLKCYQINRGCNYEEMICENKEVLVNAWRYLLGNQLMLFRLHTTRLNRFTTIDLKDAQELAAHYQVEYEAALKQVVQLVDVSSCELCCGGNPTSYVWLP